MHVDLLDMQTIPPFGLTSISLLVMLCYATLPLQFCSRENKLSNILPLQLCFRENKLSNIEIIVADISKFEI
jgi:hypothetical protein